MLKQHSCVFFEEHQNTDRGTLYCMCCEMKWEMCSLYTGKTKPPFFKHTVHNRRATQDSAVYTRRQRGFVLTSPDMVGIYFIFFRVWTVWVECGDWPRGSRRSWGGPVVLGKKLEAETERGVHWAGSGTEAEARQSRTLSASLNASSSGWSEKEREGGRGEERGRRLNERTARYVSI